MSWEKLYVRMKHSKNPFDLSTSEHRNITKRVVKLIYEAGMKAEAKDAAKGSTPDKEEEGPAPESKASKAPRAAKPATAKEASATNGEATRDCACGCGKKIALSRKRATAPGCAAPGKARTPAQEQAAAPA